MNATLRDRLILLEQQFLIAVVAQDETALREFSMELPRLIHHFKAVEASGNLDDDTALLLASVSQVIKATTQCVLDCEDILMDGRNDLMSCSNLPLPPDDLLPVSTNRPTFTPYYLLFSHISSSGSLGILGHNNLLDACAYRWLMQNIHCPYPTPAQLKIIGDVSMTSVAQAELWFQEARGVTGWTKLSDEFFTGSLNATINAAKRLYLEHDNTIPFSVVFAFSKVKASMETLFAEHPALPTPTSPIENSSEALRPAPVVNDLLDNEEIEDTTPPPAVAGCKRNRPEDTATSLASDLHRPLKRHRAKSTHQAGVPPLPKTGPSFEKSGSEALANTSAIPVSSVQLSGPSFPVGWKPSPDFLTLYPTEQRQSDICDGASEMVIVSPDLPVSQGETRNQQISECSPPAPFQRLRSPSANHGQHPFSGSVPTFSWLVSPSLGDLHTDSTGAPQIIVNPGTPVDHSVYSNVSVFDWKSFPSPLAETTISTNKPASVYVPSSDLAPLNFELSDPLYLEQSAEKGYTSPYSLDDLGSLEDFRSLLQFPIPTASPPGVSVSPSASFYSDNTSLPSAEMDLSAITDFINQFSSFSAESSSAPSPPSTIDAAPNTPDNPIGSLLPPPPHEVNKPISILDPSIPPSVFLPAEPGIFTDDTSSMWSLLCGQS